MKTTTKWQNHKLVPVTTLNSALVSTVQATDNEWLGLLIVLCVFCNLYLATSSLWILPWSRLVQ